MSVYTELSHRDIDLILSHYRLGQLQSFQGIAAGIENSNFFIDTDTGRYVLTIFERMDADELPYFMRLMHHLAHQGFVCPDVMVRRDGALLFEFQEKQGCIVSCLSGRTYDELNTAQLTSAGEAMARLHVAGATFEERRDNPTGYAWLQQTAAAMADDVAARYGAEAAALLHDEIAWQGAQDYTFLPEGVIHGDLFCDNILFEGDTVSGVIDFYYAHDAAYAMDVAIALNAQAVLLGEEDAARMQAFIDGYTSVRGLNAAELDAMPGLLRLAALRFWVSRLYDALYPREGAMVQIKDPEEYRNKLLLHRNR